MKNKLNSFKPLGKLFGLAWQIHPSLFFWFILQAVLFTVDNLLTVFLAKFVLDGLAAGWTWQNILIFLAVFGVIKLIIVYGKDKVDQRNDHETSIFTSKTDIRFAQKIMRVRYAMLEDPATLELKERATSPIQFGIIYDLINQGQILLTSTLTIIGVVAILLQFSPLLFIIITGLALAGFLFERRISVALIEFQKNLVPINRRYGYFFSKLIDDDMQKELRLYPVDKLLINRVMTANEELAAMLSEVRTQTAKGKSFALIFTVLSRFLLYSYAGLRVLGFFGTTPLSLANFTMIIGANESYAQAFRNLSVSLSEIVLQTPIIEPLFEFLALEEMDEEVSIEQNGKKPGKLKTLTFENVSFRYPKTEKWILDKVSFTINEGEAVAIVGRNNAGKSTIVKLICRLFDVDEGRILWNGEDIRSFAYDDYLEELSCVFQDFKLFPFTIQQNIATDASLDAASQQRVKEVVEQVDMSPAIEQLPLGLDTYLDKTVNEDATNFSGGQRQKLAIARAIYDESSLSILDEPTAALDPLAESEVYGHFADLIRGKTAIFISHRMSASRFCDRILVLEEGHITGDGPHNNLVQTNDLYHQLYEAQAQYYQEA